MIFLWAIFYIAIASFLLAFSYAVYKLLLVPSIIVYKLRQQNVPMAPRKFPFGQLPEVKKNHAKGIGYTSKKLTEKYGNFHVFFLGPLPSIGISDPVIAKEILAGGPKKSNCFEKSSVAKFNFNFAFGPNILTLEREEHKFQRQLLNPFFHFDALQKLIPTFVSCAEDAFVDWEQTIKMSDDAINIHACFSTLTLSVIGRAGFGFNSETSLPKSKLIATSIQLLLNQLQKLYYFSWIPFFRVFLRILWHDIDAGVKRQSDVVEKVLKDEAKLRYSNSNYSEGDLIGRMLFGSVKNKKMTINQLVSTGSTFVIAGHETTSSLLSWTIYLLAKNPEWISKLRQEVKDIDPKNITTSDIKERMTLLSMVLYESLRMYPPANNVTRRCVKDFTIFNGITIPAGIDIIIYSYQMHYDPKLWNEDPSVFNPLRFKNGTTKATTHPMAFSPFGAGSRNCIGQFFAILEAQIILCLMIKRFDFKLSEKHSVIPMQSITMKPKDGLFIKLSSRSRNIHT